MPEYFWFYVLILIAFVFLWNWNKRLKNDLEMVASTYSQDEKQTMQLNLIINLLGAIFISLTFLLILVLKGLYSGGLLL
jgi:hypothetical protein